MMNTVEDIVDLGNDMVVPRLVELPVLPMKRGVYTPIHAFPVTVATPTSVQVVRQVWDQPEEVRLLAMLHCRPGQEEASSTQAVFSTGVLAKLLKVIEIPGSVNAILSGLARVSVEQWLTDEPPFRACLRVRTNPPDDAFDVDQISALRRAGQLLVDQDPEVPAEMSFLFRSGDDGIQPWVALNALKLEVSEHQPLLELDDPNALASAVLGHLKERVGAPLIFEKLYAPELSSDSAAALMRALEDLRRPGCGRDP